MLLQQQQAAAALAVVVAKVVIIALVIIQIVNAFFLDEKVAERGKLGAERRIHIM